MKSLLLIFFVICFSANTFAINETHDLSIIRDIDDYELHRNYVEVSEEGLPSDHYIQLIQKMSIFKFTLLSEAKVHSIFEELKRNPRARMSAPGGKCSYRRSYVQNLLKSRNIITGKLLIKCPTNNGRMRLRDQVSGRYYTYSNFHDVSIVGVETGSGKSFRVMDMQFQSAPESLHEYLTKIEASQRIRPLKRRGSGSNLCYWTISTPSLTY